MMLGQFSKNHFSALEKKDYAILTVFFQACVLKEGELDPETMIGNLSDLIQFSFAVRHLLTTHQIEIQVKNIQSK